MLRAIFYIFIFLFFSGCKVDKEELKALNKIDQNSTQKVISQELSAQQKYELKKDEINKDVKIATINANSTIELAKINAQNSIDQAKIQKEIELHKDKQMVKIEQEQTKLYMIAIVVFALVIIIALIILYLINKKNNQTKLAIKEEEILKEQQMQLEAHRHESLKKILDIISSGNVSKNVEKGLLEALKHATSGMKTIEDKSSKFKKLIFKD